MRRHTTRSIPGRRHLNTALAVTDVGYTKREGILAGAPTVGTEPTDEVDESLTFRILDT